MVLGHRTVWIVTLATLAAAWWLAGRHNKGSRAGLAAPLIVAALLLAAVFVLAPNSTITQEFQRSVVETQKDNSTMAWRVDSWKSLVDDWVASGPLVWPAGKPFGAGFRRYIEIQGMETEAQAHNYYVTLLVRGGILVLCAYVAAQIVVLRRLLKLSIDTPDWLNGEVLALFIVANMVYAITYSPDFIQALCLGMVYSLTMQVAIKRNPHAPRSLTHLP